MIRMRVYTGPAASEEALREMRKHDIGWLIAADAWRFPKPGIRWCLDNGAFTAFTQGKPFPEDRFMKVFWEAEATRDWRSQERLEHAVSRPDFGVVPDIVAGGDRSLEFSLAWLQRLPSRGFPWYLAIQDGMTQASVQGALDTARWMHEAGDIEAPFGGLFIGGTLEWKHATAPEWVKYAHNVSMHAHIGRVHRLDRLVWAEQIEADSVDSSTFARGRHYSRVTAARRQARLTLNS